MKATDGFPHVDKQSHARREVRTRSRENAGLDECRALSDRL